MSSWVRHGLIRAPVARLSQHEVVLPASEDTVSIEDRTALLRMGIQLLRIVV